MKPKLNPDLKGIKASDFVNEDPNQITNEFGTTENTPLNKTSCVSCAYFTSDDEVCSHIHYANNAQDLYIRVERIAPLISEDLSFNLQSSLLLSAQTLVSEKPSEGSL